MQSNKSPEFERFKKLTKKFFSPVIYVCSTQKAKDICKKSALSPAELLRPFGIFQDVKMTIRLPEKDKIINLQQFQLLFVDAEEFAIPTRDQIDEHIKYVLKNNAPDPNQWLVN